MPEPGISVEGELPDTAERGNGARTSGRPATGSPANESATTGSSGNGSAGNGSPGNGHPDTARPAAAPDREAPGPELEMPGPELEMPGPELEMPGSDRDAPAPELAMPGSDREAPAPDREAPVPELAMPGSDRETGPAAGLSAAGRQAGAATEPAARPAEDPVSWSAGDPPGRSAGPAAVPDTGRRAASDPRHGAGQGSGQPAAARARQAASRQLRNLVALLLYAGVSLGMFGPWILDRMSTWFLSAQPQDGSLFVWAFSWWPFALSHHYSAFYSYAAWAPAGINLTWATTIPAPSLALQAFTHSYGPIFSFNLAELAAPPLAAWTAYLLCRRITRSFFPALIGGFLFGFSPALIDEVGQGHPSLTLVFLVPLCAYLVFRLLEGSIRPLVYVPLLGIVLAAQFYIGDEILATMTLVGALCAAVAFAAGPAARRQRLLRAIAPTAGAYAIAVIFAIPLLSTAFTRPRIIKAIHFATIEYGAKGTGDFLRYLTPGRFTEHWGIFMPRWGDNPWYLGVPLIIVIIAFAVTERRRRATWMLIAGLLLILLVSLGDVMSVFGAPILPWRLFAAMPVLNIAQPGRLVTFAYLVIAVIVARWLTPSTWPVPPPPEPSAYPPSSPLWRPTPVPRRSLRPLGWLPVLLAALTIVPNFSENVWAESAPMPPFLATGAYRRYIAPGEIIWLLEVHPSRALIWQAETGFYFRISGGFFGGTPQGVPEGQLQERLAMGQVPASATTADIQHYIAVHHIGAILTAQTPWPVILKIREAVGSRGMRPQGRMRLFRLSDPFGLQAGPAGQPGGLGSWAGAAHRLPPRPAGQHGRPNGRLGHRAHRRRLAHQRHRAANHQRRGAARQARRPTGKRGSP